MKNTKIMLAVIGMFIVTWIFFGLGCMALSGYDTLGDAMMNGLVLFFMVIIGWAPSLIVGIDLNEYLENKN